jgi:hypothetical protein
MQCEDYINPKQAEPEKLIMILNPKGKSLLGRLIEGGNSNEITNA